MMKTALIQSNNTEVENDWWSSGCESAANGFKKLGYTVKPFHSLALDQAPLAKNKPLRGSIRTVRTALKLLGCEQPQNVDIPVALKGFAGREIWASTLKEVRKSKKDVFIKPLEIQKDFDGHVFNAGKDFWGNLHESYETRQLPGSYKVLCQEVIHFLKEWRAYVINGELVSVRHFHTSSRHNNNNFYEQNRQEEAARWKLRPDYAQIRKMIRAFKDQPAGFVLDVGIIEGKKGMHLVEMNEGFSAGNYGISNVRYAKMIEARWNELVQRKAA